MAVAKGGGPWRKVAGNRKERLIFLRPHADIRLNETATRSRRREMTTCEIDNLTQRPEAPTRQNIAQMREKQLNDLKALRRLLAQSRVLSLNLRIA